MARQNCEQIGVIDGSYENVIYPVVFQPIYFGTLINVVNVGAHRPNIKGVLAQVKRDQKKNTMEQTRRKKASRDYLNALMRRTSVCMYWCW